MEPEAVGRRTGQVHAPVAGAGVEQLAVVGHGVYVQLVDLEHLHAQLRYLAPHAHRAVVGARQPGEQPQNQYTGADVRTLVHTRVHKCWRTYSGPSVLRTWRSHALHGLVACLPEQSRAQLVFTTGVRDNSSCC